MFVIIIIISSSSSIIIIVTAGEPTRSASKSASSCAQPSVRVRVPADAGYYVKVVTVEVVMADLGQYHLPVSKPKSVNKIREQNSSAQRLGYNRPDHDHPPVALTYAQSPY